MDPEITKITNLMKIMEHFYFYEESVSFYNMGKSFISTQDRANQHFLNVKNISLHHVHHDHASSNSWRD